MTNLIGASTVDDALASLTAMIGQNAQAGEKNLIFCEDRLTLVAERAIVSEFSGTFDTEVTTFARFLSDGRKVLSKQGSIAEISALLKEHEKELGCFKSRAAGAVYETLAQLCASRVSAQALRAGAAETEGVLKLKLLDLALLLEKYEEFLKENGFVDENGYLALLPEKIERELKDTNVYFVLFPSFTAQAREGVRSAVEHAKSVTGIFLAGKEELYTNEGARLFRRVAEEYGEVKIYKSGCCLEGDALALRSALFSPEKFTGEKISSHRVHVFAAKDEAEELDRVAALIRSYVGRKRLRYRDFAVLVPDPSRFPAVEKAFGLYKIPFYADQKRSFAAHPFCGYVLSVLRAVAGGLLSADVDEVASNVCFGDGGQYRNYLLKFGGYRGAVKREIKEGEAVRGYDLSLLSACREKMLGALSLFPKKGTGREYTDAVKSLLARTRWEEIEEDLKRSCGKEEAQFLDISPLERILEEISAVAGGREFAAQEFCALLQSGLESLEISMIPASADGVFVGDATESRLTRVKVLFATGLTDCLPRVSKDTAVITDGEIKRLSSLSVEIEPAIAQVNARARESLALNLCAFEEELYLSYPLRVNGEEAQRGEIVDYAERTFSPAPMPEVFPYDCCEREPALLRLLDLKDGFERGERDETREFNALFEALKRKGEGARAAALLSGGEKERVTEAGKLYFAGGSVSPTLLENYFACPYYGFASRALKLREREERTVLDTDTGTFIHRVLETVARNFNSIQDEAACRAQAEEAARELLKSPRFSSLADTRAGAYTGERLVREGVEVTAAAYRQISNSSFRVRETEEKISLPALSLEGTADRVDVSDGYVRVIDYKTGEFDDSASAYYTGRRLQLELYLLASLGGGEPAGAFYFPAAENYAKEGEAQYRMGGFFCGEEDVVARMDATLKEGEKSAFFEGGRTGKLSNKGMSKDDFRSFLDYSLLVSEGAEEEMKAGNIAPSPYEGACAYCKYGSLCAFTGNARKEGALKCGEIAAVAKKRRGVKDGN